MVVLKPGFPGNHLTGQAAVTGIYVKFQNGIVDIKDESMIEKMKLHPGFDRDYICVEEKEKDPYAYNRDEVEPVHYIKELKYGHVEGTQKSPRAAKISPELQKFIEEQATNLAKAMLPGMMKEFIQQMKNAPSNPSEMKKLEEVDSVANDEDTDTNVKIDKKPKGKIKKDETEDAPTV